MLTPAPDPSFDPNKDDQARYVSEHGPIQFQMTLYADGVVMYTGRSYLPLAEALSIAHDVSVEAAIQLRKYKEKAEEN